MCKRLSSLFETAKETTTTIIWLCGVVAMIGGMGVAFGSWFSKLNAFQVVSFYIMVIALLAMVGTLVLDWMRKRDIERIPDLIEKLDVLVSNFVDNFTIDLTKSEWSSVNKDYGNILGLDLSGLEATLLGDHTRAELDRAFESVSRAYTRKLDPQNKTGESLVYLG